MALLPENIPGMIERIEQELLLDLARSVRLRRDEVVCEVGSYLGRSTRCLANGLLENETLDLRSRGTAVLHAFDVFSCAQSGLFAGHLMRDIRRANLERLLRVEGARVDFSGVFDHYMQDLPSGLLARHQTALAAARHPGGAIALMHVDAPKWYAEFRQMLVAFGSALQPGAYAVFQDFFYHWSAELIAAITLFIELGHFEPVETAASSLLVRVNMPVLASDVDHLDLVMREVNCVAVVARAIARFEDFEVDRPEIFLSRLYLAAAQSCHESGDLLGSRSWVDRMRRRVGHLSPQVALDLAELDHYGHSLRRLYEGDIQKPSAPI